LPLNTTTVYLFISFLYFNGYVIWSYFSINRASHRNLRYMPVFSPSHVNMQ